MFFGHVSNIFLMTDNFVYFVKVFTGGASYSKNKSVRKQIFSMQKISVRFYKQ